MDSKVKKIIVIGIATRIIIILLQFVANILVPDHDANVFLYPKQNLTLTFWDKTLTFLLGGFVRWDAQYFMHIANYGYTYENTLAFFPLYPFLIKRMSSLLSPFVMFVNEESLLLLIFVLFNCYIFVKAALILHELTVRVLKDHDLAYKSVILFCVNPATVFFVAPYSECLFSYLTFRAMLSCILMYDNDSSIRLKFKSMILIAASTCVRSNGLLNIGFLAYFNIKACLKHRRTLRAVEYLLLVLCLLPFVALQIYDYYKFCTHFNHNLEEFLVDYAKLNEFVLPGSVSHRQSWCFDKIPLAYSYIQNHYWNVGFLRYFELKQIPNFMLALPVIVLVGVSTFRFVRTNLVYCLTLGLARTKSVIKIDLYQPKMFVFVMHAAALAVFCLLCIHVQVSTRMICSSSPVIYWYCAYYFKNVKERNDSLQSIFLFNNNLDFKQKCIRLYFIGYCIVGTVLFSNFLPWT